MATYVTPWPCVVLSARNDVGRTNENTAVAINVLGNDVGSLLKLQKLGGGAAQIGDVVAQIQTSYGLVRLTLGANNQIVFDPAGLFSSLQEGQSTSFKATYKVADSSGRLASAQITIRVDGSNDEPTFRILNPSSSIAEAINASSQNIAPIQGRLIILDSDIGDVLVAKTVGTPTVSYSGGTLPAGSNLSALTSQSALALSQGLSNGGTRTLSWIYDPNSANLDFLRQGETLSIRYRIAVSDGHSQAATQNLVFNIKGTNDAPIIKVTDPAFDVSGILIETNAALAATGRVSFADPDRADTPAATVNTSTAVVSTTGIVLSAAQAAAFKAGFAITNASTGAWTYNLPAAASQFLGVGDQVKVVYPVVVTDDFGSPKKQLVTVTIDGTNDRPTVVVLAPASVYVEAPNASAQNLPPTQGALLISDADLGDTLTPQIVGVPVLMYSGGALPINANLNALISPSALTFGSNALSNGGVRNIGWTYDPAAVNLDFLGQGETLAIRYRIAVSDGHSLSTTNNLTLRIVGTNDAPKVNATAASAFTEADDASAQDLSQVGTVSFDDIDANDVIDITASYNGDIAWSHGSLSAATIAALTLGTFVARVTDAAAPGSTPWTYIANDVDLDFLDAGESITFSFTVSATDDKGAASTEDITFTINGTDEPVTLDASVTPAFTQQAGESDPYPSQSAALSYYLMTSAF